MCQLICMKRMQALSSRSDEYCVKCFNEGYTTGGLYWRMWHLPTAFLPSREYCIEVSCIADGEFKPPLYYIDREGCMKDHCVTEEEFDVIEKKRREKEQALEAAKAIGQNREAECS